MFGNCICVKTALVVYHLMRMLHVGHITNLRVESEIILFSTFVRLRIISVGAVEITYNTDHKMNLFTLRNSNILILEKVPF